MKGIIGLILSGIALLLQIIGIAIPYWWYYGVTERKVFVGLWEFCVTVNGTTSCIPLPDMYIVSKVEAVRTLELLGMIGMAIATVCVLVKLIAFKDNERLPKLAGVTAIVSGVLMMLGGVIFATIKSIEGVVFHAGFPLCLAAGVIALAAGVLIILNK